MRPHLSVVGEVAGLRWSGGLTARAVLKVADEAAKKQ
jgi:hypothetical protein